MEYEKIRNYEVSIWTLQDSFITVLKPSDLENKGQIQEGKFKLNTDGTQELTFNVPMYLEPGVENPVWYDIKNGIIIEDMRKIKLIFNKNTDDEEVFEFLINSVTERHENDQLYCEVSCEGLAFNELGKRGFKVALNEDDYYNDENVIAWYNSAEKVGDEPVANIQYWLNKFLKPLPTNSEEINPYTWYYELNMDWTSYPNGNQLASDKIYEDEYATVWGVEGSELVAKKVEPQREKSRLVDISESNFYNLTSQLAEVFGVFCKYVYEHDSNYHITCKKVVFYNTFYAEKEGFIDFTYPFSSSQITRTKDSKDLVTKLFVKSVDDKDTASGLITILDADTNPTKEDYILNFDYLHEIGTISEEQYAQIKEYEKEIFQLNSQIIPLDEQITVLSEQLPDLEAQLTIAKNAAQQDTERLEDANSLYENLTEGDGTIEITTAAPRSGILLQDSSEVDKKNYYYVKISEQGVIPSTVHIYTALKYSRNSDGTTISLVDKDKEITNFTPQYDEYGNLNRLNNIYWTDTKKTVYLTYKYSPKLYYDNVKKIWEKRLAKDQADTTALKTKVDFLKNEISNYERDRDDLLKQKKDLIKIFEEEFGAAIREGYWTPEDYTNYGNRLNDSIQVDLAPINDSDIFSFEINGLTSYASFIWDKKNFEGEQESYYELGVNQDKNYYPCIDLKPAGLIDQIKDHLDDLCLLYWDYTPSETMPRTDNRLRSLPLGSQCQLAFIYDNNKNVHPVLLITGEKSLYGSSDETAVQWMIKTGFIGKLSTQLVGNVINTTATRYISHDQIEWIELNDNKPIVYPRIKINSLALKTGPDEQSVIYKGNKLEQYQDYSIASRTDIDDQNNITSAYYFTLKPSTLIKYGTVNGVLNFFYTLSTAANAIYLDALQVSRENAYPKVSYTISPNLYGRDFMHIAYKYLGVLAHINDTDLKFENVMGYISDLELDLDKPWEDQIEIKNYKSKFEDIFSSIVAQTEAMKSSQPILSSAANVLMLDGTLSQNAIQDTLRRVDLNYAFNNGTLTIDNENGIWGTSDNGVVAMRGGGIFTATERSEDGYWKWNTGITPEGINADLITTGQLDTNLIKIYAGDKVKFQMNGDGIFAYRSFIDDMRDASSNVQGQIQRWIDDNIEDGITDDLDRKQYIKYDENGLFLIAEQNALVINNNKNGFIGPLSQTTRRVEISWDGLKLRDWDNDEVFYADPDTGNLTLKGRIEATGGDIGGWSIGTNTLQGDNIVLRGSGDSSGIDVTSANANSYTITYDNNLYYTYTNPANGNIYYYPDSIEDLTVSSTNRTNIIKQGVDIVSVTPKYIIEEDITDTREETVEVITETGETEKKTIETEYTYTVRYVGSDSTTPIIINEEKLIYDGSTDPNPISSTWYTSLTSAQQQSYVNYQTIPSTTNYDSVPTNELSDGTVLKLVSFAPTLSIEAKTGKLTTNYGKLGSFDLTASSLANGTLDNTRIINSAISASKIEGKPTKNFLRAFCDISGNSATGNYTLTRIDGTTANFNITAMQKYQTDMTVNYQSGYSSGWSEGNSTGYTSAAGAASRSLSISPNTETTIDPGGEQKVIASMSVNGQSTTRSVTIKAKNAGVTGGWTGSTFKASISNNSTDQSVSTSIDKITTSGDPTRRNTYFLDQNVQAQLEDGYTVLTDTISVNASDVYTAGKNSIKAVLTGTPTRPSSGTSGGNATEGWYYQANTDGRDEEDYSGYVYVPKYSISASAWNMGTKTFSKVTTTNTPVTSASISLSLKATQKISEDPNKWDVTVFDGNSNTGASTIVDATSRYTAGAKSVTISPGGWTQYATNTITASNGAYTTVSIPDITVTAGSWSNGSRTINAYYGNSGVLGSTTISLPSASNVSWSWSNPAQGYVSASITIAGKTYSSQHKV